MYKFLQIKSTTNRLKDHNIYSIEISQSDREPTYPSLSLCKCYTSYPLPTYEFGTILAPVKTRHYLQAPLCIVITSFEDLKTAIKDTAEYLETDLEILSHTILHCLPIENVEGNSIYQCWVSVGGSEGNSA
uniref:Uncharacterized protein n=1 Tax=Miglotas virus TaxID=2800927 RepID=A0A894KJF5_9VIRU|nr:MAG: hypothetical protein [Miglotas virus]